MPQNLTTSEYPRRPRVSIIVPAYKTEDFLPACLDSLVNQTMPDFEAICVDDGSPDRCGHIIDEWTVRDSRFKAIHRENGGLSAARNSGLEIAQGDYVAFLDSDDLYAPHALERMLALADEHDLDLLDFTGASFSHNPHLVKHTEGFEKRRSIEGVFSGPSLLEHYQQLQEYYCSACFHLIDRNMLERTGLRFLEGIIHEDELFTPLLHAHAHRAAFLNEGLYLRRVREDSIITTKRGLRNVESLFVITQHLEAWLRQHASEYSPCFVDAFAQRIYELRDVMTHDALIWCTPEELEEATEKLVGKERIEWRIHVLEARRALEKYHDHVRSSTSYRLGNALLHLPRKLHESLLPRR